MHFEINDKNSNQIGLLERRGREQFAFIKEKNELENDQLYYLYFREKPDRSLNASTPQMPSTNSQLTAAESPDGRACHNHESAHEETKNVCLFYPLILNLML